MNIDHQAPCADYTGGRKNCLGAVLRWSFLISLTSVLILSIADVDLKLAIGPDLEKEVLSNGRLVSFDRDTVLFREGEHLKWALILVEGSVQLFHKNFERGH